MRIRVSVERAPAGISTRVPGGPVTVPPAAPTTTPCGGGGGGGDGGGAVSSPPPPQAARPRNIAASRNSAGYFLFMYPANGLRGDIRTWLMGLEQESRADFRRRVSVHLLMYSLLNDPALAGPALIQCL